MPEKKDHPDNSPIISRRRFLEGVAKGFAGATAAVAEQQLHKQERNTGSLSGLIRKFFDRNRNPHQETTPVEQKLFQEIPGPANVALIDVVKDYDYQPMMQKWKSEIGFSAVSTDWESPDHRERILQDDNYAKSFLVEQAIENFSNHGASMAEIISSPNNSQEKMKLFSLQDAVTHIYFRRDELGNPILGVYIDPEILSKFLKQTDAQFVNMSFQVGWLEFSAVVRNQEFPLLHEHKVNGESVWTRYGGAEIRTDETGKEFLIDPELKSMNIEKWSPEEKADFLLTQLDQWTEAERQFLLDIEKITENDSPLNEF